VFSFKLGQQELRSRLHLKKDIFQLNKKRNCESQEARGNYVKVNNFLKKRQNA
jgi:hypothetical protein